MQYGVNRYQTETRRLYSVLDKHLASDNRPYLCGTKCTIAGELKKHATIFIAATTTTHRPYMTGLVFATHPPSRTWSFPVLSQHTTCPSHPCPSQPDIRSLIRSLARPKLASSSAKPLARASPVCGAEKAFESANAIVPLFTYYCTLSPCHSPRSPVPFALTQPQSFLSHVVPEKRSR